jgi:broad specificity phosphatase PhoE
VVANAGPKYTAEQFGIGGHMKTDNSPATTFLLIRHGTYDDMSRILSGSRPGVGLNASGRAEIARLASCLHSVPVRALYSSPLPRARETATLLAETLRVPVEISEAFGEIDFGDWAGRSFDDLAGSTEWRNFNTCRSGAPTAAGQLMAEVQTRAVREMMRLANHRRGETVCVISHGDVIKAALAYYAGIPLDLFHRLEISPSSVSAIRLHDSGPQLLCINWLDHVPC